ncbi:MAG: restriction endonuclease [Propionicimonas sp.]|nr:restriction endonuclease [Propionicimonas sp.]
MTAWVVRAGARGEAEQLNLQQGVATIGWRDIGDLSIRSSREQVRALVDQTYPSFSAPKAANITGQLWAFRNSIQPGDLVIMPLKTQPADLTFGRCTGAYSYNMAEPDPDRRHQLPVEWATELVARTALRDDLLNMINGAMTVFSPSRNNAAARLEAVSSKGADPGATAVRATPAASKPTLEQSGDDVYDAPSVPTMEAIRDRITTHLVEKFTKHKLTRLVADILEALGFVCEVSPEGPDGGVDIFAGKGPLGLDAPILIVEVKSETTKVGVDVVHKLFSALTQHGADQGLLVAYGGVNEQARKGFAQQRGKLRIWNMSDLLEQLFLTYGRLPASTRAELPLKQTWVLDVE